MATITGTNGDDILTDTPPADTISGLDGNDRITITSGRDTIQGGLGLDILVIDWGVATQSIITSTTPSADASGFSGAYRATDFSREAVYQQIDRFVITTGSGNDTIVTAGGDDEVRTGIGNDFVNVGQGVNIADGGDGIDVFAADFSDQAAGVTIDLRNPTSTGAFGSVANFELFGNIVGSAFGDMLLAGDATARDESYVMGDGDDTVTIMNGSDTVNGGSGLDTLIIDWSAAIQSISSPVGPTADASGFGGSYRSTDFSREALYQQIDRFVITTGSGNDTIVTGGGNDDVRTGIGADFVNVGQGVNTADGGDGIDVIAADFSDRTAGVTLDLRDASNTGAFGTFSNFELFGNITGSAFGDVLLASNTTARDENYVMGGGNDTVTILNGRDTVNGGSGVDTLIIDWSASAQSIGTASSPTADVSGFSGVYQATDSSRRATYQQVDRFVITTGSGNDTITAGGGDDVIDGGAGNDTLNGGAGISDTVSYASASAGVTVDLRITTAQNTVGAGTDTLAAFERVTGSVFADTLTGNQFANWLTGGAGTDTLIGLGGNDSYFVEDLDDVVIEQAGDGTDAVFTELISYTLPANVEGLYSDYLDDLTAPSQTFTGNDLDNFISTANGDDVVFGGVGNDQLSGFGGNDVIDGGPGADRMSGGEGDDIFIVDDAGDAVFEPAFVGTNADEVRTALTAYTLPTNVERLTYTGTAAATLRGNASDNVIAGGDAGDLFFLQNGGSDVAMGLGGDDGFYFGAALTAADEVDGGSGTLDQVGLQGNYAAGLTLGARALVGIEQLVLLPGSDTRFGDTSGALYSYSLTTIDANVAAGQQLIVTFNTLRTGENVTFNGAAENDGSFLTFGGAGMDRLTGGQQDDGFYFGFDRWGASDRVDGQGGTMDQLGLQGIYNVTFGAGQIVDIEFLVLLSGGDTRFGAGGQPYTYDITMNDDNVAAGQVFVVSANGLRTDETLTFDGSAETNAVYRIFSGQGADDISGGGGADTIGGGIGADLLSGGGGDDLFVYTAVTDSRTTGGIDHIRDFAAGDRIDLGAIDANSVGGGADDAFTFIGSAAFSGGGAAGAGQLRVTGSGGAFVVEGDTDGDGVADITIQVSASDPATSLGAAQFVL